MTSYEREVCDALQNEEYVYHFTSEGKTYYVYHVLLRGNRRSITIRLIMDNGEKGVLVESILPGFVKADAVIKDLRSAISA